MPHHKSILRDEESNIASTGQLNNLSIPTEFLRFTGTGAVTVTGFATPVNGKRLLLQNSTTAPLILAHQNAGSTTANQLFTLSGTNYSLPVGGFVSVVYVNSIQRWQVMPVGGGIPGEETAQVGEVPVKTETGYEFKFPNELETSPPILVTYAEIIQLIADSGLIQGKYYQITDFQTVHIIPNSSFLNVHGTLYTDKTTWTRSLSEGVEELVVQATSETTIGIFARSIQNPLDYIEYDVYNSLCSDGVTPRNGKILVRRDTSKNIHLNYDWRYCRFIRYRITPADYNAANTYNANNVVKYNNIVYVCLVNGTTGIAPSNAASNLNWAQLYHREANLLGWYVATTAGAGAKLGRWTVSSDASDYIILGTFNRATGETTADPYDNNNVNLNDFYMDRSGNTDSLPNTVYVAHMTTSSANIKRVIAGADFNNNTFFGVNQNIKWDINCHSNLINNQIYSSNFGTDCHTNVLWSNTQVLANNRATASFNNNLVNGLQSAEFVGWADLNIIKSQFVATVCTTNLTSNVFHAAVNYSRFLHRLRSSVFQGAIDDSTFLVPLLSKIFTTAIHTKNITHKSPSNKAFASSVDDNGVITTTEIT